MELNILTFPLLPRGEGEFFCCARHKLYRRVSSGEGVKMKKPILVLLSLLLFTSCGGGGSTNYLSHQTYPLEARGVLEYDGHRYTVVISV